MKSAHARARAFALAPRERSRLSRRPAFALEPPAEMPDLETQMDRAVRFGHRPETFLARSSAAMSTDVVQREDSSDESEEEKVEKKSSRSRRARSAPKKTVESSESSDEGDNDSGDDYYEAPPRQGKKKQDPNSLMVAKSYKTTDKGFKYKTAGGAKHVESFDPKTLTRITKTQGLTMAGPQFRNGTLRNDISFRVFNPYNLSKGQSSQNQLVVSHNSPSWGGMRAGGQYGNSSETSRKFNSLVEDKEKDWRKDLRNSTHPFDYQTETRYEKISDFPRPEDVANVMTNRKWQDPERVKKRLDKIVELNPNAMRIQSETRTLSGHKRQRTANLKSDLYYGMPSRAYHPEAHKKYIKARGQDSEGSDEELNPPQQKKPKTKKKKKRK